MATEYRISTITYIGSITCRVDIMGFFDEVSIVHEDGGGIVRVEYRTKEGELRHRGATPSFVRRLRRRRKPVERFDNQVTCLIRPHEDLHAYLTNCKVFRNGNIQITGARSERDAEWCVDELCAEVRRAVARGAGGHVLQPDSPEPKAVYGKICLINSDFRVPFRINNHLLQELIIRRYRFVSIYEPCIYPAAKIVYYYNRDRPNEGVCTCRAFCSGRGCGEGDGQCKKVTIAVFQSGSVIITGASDLTMLDCAYKFTVRILLQHRGEIERRAPIERVGGASSSASSLPLVSELQRAMRGGPAPAHVTAAAAAARQAGPPAYSRSILRFFMPKVEEVSSAQKM